MKLTDAICRGAKYEGKRAKITDGNGLYLHILPSGKYFRWDYKHSGKRKTLSIGVYPAVTLKQARDLLHDAKAVLKSGSDPSVQKKVLATSDQDRLFGSVAEEWDKHRKVAPATRKNSLQRLRKDVLPVFERVRVDTITPPDVLAIIRKIQKRESIDAAHKTLGDISQIMRYAVGLGYVDSDPCRDIKNQARKNKRVTNRPALTKKKAFGKLLVDINNFNEPGLHKHALRLYPHLALRPSELRTAKWSYVNFDKRKIVFPKRDHAQEQY